VILLEVEFHAPEIPQFDMRFRGIDGQVYTLRASDYAHMQFGGYWKTFCPKVSAGLPFRIAVAAVNNKTQQAPKKLEVLGSYEAILNEGEGSKFVKFDRTVDVTR